MSMTSPGVSFTQHLSDFSIITGEKPSATVLADAGDGGQALFHEACIYHKPSHSLFVTSNQLMNEDGKPNAATSDKHIRFYRIHDSSDGTPARVEQVEFAGWEGATLNGGVNYGPNKVLMCAQGSKDDKDVSGLITLPVSSCKASTKPDVILSSFHGIPFNSVNDVVIHPTEGTIWFTDPCYGFHQKIRNAPQLPNQVYCYDPYKKVIRVVADGFTRPNGLCFSHDLTTMYVTDTGAVHGSSDVAFDMQGPSHIYAFDVLPREKPSVLVSDQEPTYLANKRLFAFSPGRCPDGIKCDKKGNVYSGTGAGIEVWNKSGDPLGVIKIDGGVANFCFGDPGVIYACNETKIWKVKISDKVEGALLANMKW